MTAQLVWILGPLLPKPEGTSLSWNPSQVRSGRQEPTSNTTESRIF